MQHETRFMMMFEPMHTADHDDDDDVEDYEVRRSACVDAVFEVCKQHLFVSVCLYVCKCAHPLAQQGFIMNIAAHRIGSVHSVLHI